MQSYTLKTKRFIAELKKKHGFDTTDQVLRCYLFYDVSHMPVLHSTKEVRDLLSDKIYTREEIEKAKSSPSFEREYNLKYLGHIGNVFNPADIDAALLQYDLIQYIACFAKRKMFLYCGNKYVITGPSFILLVIADRLDIIVQQSRSISAKDSP